jgi:signal transduction histidine kinase
MAGKRRPGPGRNAWVELDDLSGDLAAVSRIDALPAILEVVCRITGLGYAAVARVTADRWVACAVRDEIDFGVRAGSELLIETTICNEIRDSGETVAIDHVAEDPRYCRHPTPAAYGFQSYISTPIVLRDGRFFGTLCAVDRRPAQVNRPDIVGTCKLFAQLIAFHLDQRELLADLEVEVIRRTAALRADRQALRALAGRLQRVREEERAALARELHDEFAQVLTALKLDLASLRRTVVTAPEAGDAVATIADMDATIGTMLDGRHRIVRDLRPIIFDALGFNAAARSTVAEFERRHGIAARFDADLDVPLPDEIGIALYRVLQEALTNVLRHAQASRVDVSLRIEREDAVLRISDDGRGVAPAEARKPTAFGLRGMEERLRALGGSFSLEARAGGGTALIARVRASGRGSIGRTAAAASSR